MSPERLAKVNAAWPAIVRAIADGSAIWQAAELAGIGRPDIFEYRRLHPEVEKEFQAALENWAESVTDDIERTISQTEGDHRLARVRADYLWRLAAARNPERYSERRNVDVRVTQLDLTHVISEAQRRLEARERARIIDGTAQRIAEPVAIGALL